MEILGLFMEATDDSVVICILDMRCLCRPMWNLWLTEEAILMNDNF